MINDKGQQAQCARRGGFTLTKVHAQMIECNVHFVRYNSHRYYHPSQVDIIKLFHPHSYTYTSLLHAYAPHCHYTYLHTVPSHPPTFTTMTIKSLPRHLRTFTLNTITTRSRHLTCMYNIVPYHTHMHSTIHVYMHISHHTPPTYIL